MVASQPAPGAQPGAAQQPCSNWLPSCVLLPRRNPRPFLLQPDSWPKDECSASPATDRTMAELVLVLKFGVPSASLCRTYQYFGSAVCTRACWLVPGHSQTEISTHMSTRSPCPLGWPDLLGDQSPKASALWMKEGSHLLCEHGGGRAHLLGAGPGPAARCRVHTSNQRMYEPLCNQRVHGPGPQGAGSRSGGSSAEVGGERLSQGPPSLRRSHVI